jgi:hypothetical protein
MSTILVRTPVCFRCHRADLVTLPTAAAAALAAGALMQEALPELPRPVREQLITGTHPACWAAAFGIDPADSQPAGDG